MELDPVSQIFNQALCAMYKSAHQIDLSIQQCSRFAATYPDVAMPHNELSSDYAAQKNYPKAFEERQTTLRLDQSSDMIAPLAQAYAAGGWTATLKNLAEIYQTPAHYDSLGAASCYGELGDKDKAFFWLNKAFDDHELLFIKSTPEFDFLHDDPRYADLLRRMGLPQ